MTGIGIVRVPSGMSTNRLRPSTGSRASPSRAVRRTSSSLQVPVHHAFPDDAHAHLTLAPAVAGRHRFMRRRDHIGLRRHRPTHTESS